MDAIALLQRDHEEVEQLFRQFEKLTDRAQKSKQKIVMKVIRQLAIHAAIEEMLFYPAVREAAENDDVDETVLEALEEHHIVKWVLWELERTSAEDERFEAKVTVLMENVRHHVEEEEKELFPRVNKLLGRARLDELGDAMVKAKKTVPTHPHPRSPDEPPGNLVAGAGAALVDKAFDAGRRLVRRG
jgi:hemerythrin superfamily protein